MSKETFQIYSHLLHYLSLYEKQIVLLKVMEVKIAVFGMMPNDSICCVVDGILS